MAMTGSKLTGLDTQSKTLKGCAKLPRADVQAPGQPSMVITRHPRPPPLHHLRHILPTCLAAVPPMTEASVHRDMDTPATS
eukprot:1161944-Pelagomonas_calceolata.AAC.19